MKKNSFNKSFLFSSLIFLFFIFQVTSILSQNITENEFLLCLDKTNYTCAHEKFERTLAEKFSASQLKSTWESIILSNGKLKSYQFNCSESSNSNELQISYFTCEFELKTIDLKIVLNKNREIAGFFLVPVHQCNIKESNYTAPPYHNQKLFRESGIEIKSDTFRLKASLCFPVVSKVKSICIFIHGSGAHDRDETIGTNKPFKDIAHGLASNGIASIRFDKRTFSYKELPSEITIKEEVTDDVRSVIKYIMEDKELNKLDIYLVGHSLGGMLAPKIASENKAVKGCVLMAANANKWEHLLISQMEYIAKLDGQIDINEQYQLQLIREQLNYLDDSLSSNTSSEKLPLNLPASYWMSLKEYNQLEVVKNLQIPILFLQGKRDYQVTMNDYRLWKKSISNKKKTKLKSYKKLNHLFFEGTGKSTPKEYTEASHVPYYVVKDIVKWINSKK
jgi:esterase/lipase